MSIHWACAWASVIAAFASALPAATIPRPAPTTILPVLIKKPNFEARTECEVLKINLTADGKHARSVTYLDAHGVEVEQPGDMVLVCAYGLMNVRMMLLSKIGAPYDPVSGKGVVGRNYCYQTSAGARLCSKTSISTRSLVQARWARPSMTSMVTPSTIPNWISWAARASAAPWTNGRPISNRPTALGNAALGAPNGSRRRRRAIRMRWASAQNKSYPVRENYLDSDPTYTDRHGRPRYCGDVRFPRQ